jgi:uncharacterized DUF497 family protein
MMRFEWDPRKAESNLRKHDVSFQLASQAFFDPFVRYGPITFVGGEERWSVFGEVAGTLIYVAFTTSGEGDEERVRIISARRATGSERREFERR